MRCLAGLVKPFSGEISVNGINVPEDSRRAHRHISYLSDVFGLYDNLTARQCLRYAALAFDLPPAEIEPRIVETAAMLNLTEHLESYAGTLSRGLRQRLAIALGIIHRPAFIILDEPASGLDPEARLELSRLFVNLKEKGHTLLISSHILAELEDYATDVIVLNAGRLVRYEQIGGNTVVSSQNPHVNLTIRVKGSADQLFSFLQNENCVSDLHRRHSSVGMTLWGQDDRLAALLKRLIAADIAVVEYKTTQSALKDAYFGNVERRRLRC